MGLPEGRCPFDLALKAYGVPVTIRASQPAALARLRQRLPPGWRPAPRSRAGRGYSLIVPRAAGPWTLYAGAARLARGRELDPLLDKFESDLQLHVAELAPRYVFVHAGVVGWRGRAILLPGRSMAGKSVLVAEWLRAGATDHSDEYAVLDGRGRVHPYAPPARPSDGERGARPAGAGSPERLRPKAACGAAHRPRRAVPLSGGSPVAPPAAVPRRGRPGPHGQHRVCRARPRPCAPGDPRLVVLHAPVLQGLRGEARDMAAALFDLAGGPGRR